MLQASTCMEGSVLIFHKKQNERWTTQAQPTEPLVLYQIYVLFLKFLCSLPTFTVSGRKGIKLSSFRGEDFYKSSNQKQELPVVAMFGNGS
jgi:hypothetical protein